MKKLELAAFIQGRVNAIQEVYRFDPNHGYAQTYTCAPGNPSAEHSRVYGEFSAFQDLVERFELPVNLDPPSLPERRNTPALQATEAFQESRKILEGVS